jgi:hypothetical protein
MNPSPSSQGSTDIPTLKGSGVCANVGRSLLFPRIAVPKTREIATLRNEEAA